MSEEPRINDERVGRRAELLAEEKAAGSDDPQAQAESILADSEERIASRNAAPDTHLEHRTSKDATPPAD
jgi:hypothetical protein